MKIELLRSSHAAGEANFHFLFTPAYRRAIFAREKVEKLTKAYMRTGAETLQIMISAINAGPDHLHVFVSNCKNYSVAQIAQRLKGFVSYMMRKNHKPLFSDLLWGKKFWTSGYFYRSVGAVTKETIKYYIENSQEKHWEVVDYEFYKYDKQRMLSEFN